MSSYLPWALSRLQCSQSGFPPVPGRRFAGSMLLPSVHAVLLWCTDCLIECQGLTVGICHTPSLNELEEHGLAEWVSGKLYRVSHAGFLLGDELLAAGSQEQDEPPAHKR